MTVEENVHSHSGATFTGWVGELARVHTVPLARIGRAEGLHPDAALDAVQEALTTFLLLPQARTLIGYEEDSRALLSVIVRNAARNLRRRNERSRPTSFEPDHDTTDEAPATEELMAMAEEHVRLRGCVNRLNEIQRSVVTLRMLEEVSGAHVAAALQLEPGHVAVLLHRAKKDLRDCMLE